MADTKLSVIVCTHNSREVLPAFLDQLPLGLEGIEADLLVVDNASSDEPEAFVRSRRPRVEFLGSPRNEGYGAALNRGIAAATTPFVALMNPDVAVCPAGFRRLVAFLEERPRAAGVSGPITKAAELAFSEHRAAAARLRIHRGYESLATRLLYYCGVQTRFADRPWAAPWSYRAAADEMEATRIHGCFGVFRREALLEVGCFDPRFFLFFEEDDLALRLRNAGWKLYVTDRVSIVHLSGKGSAPTSRFMRPRALLNSQYLFFRKHRSLSYAWAAFFAIWAALTVVLPLQILRRHPDRRATAELWLWHLRSVLRGGGLPPGTVPQGCEGVDYRWSADPRSRPAGKARS